MSWTKIHSIKLTSASDPITSPVFVTPPRWYFQILAYVQTSTGNGTQRVGNGTIITTTDYAGRFHNNGSIDDHTNESNAFITTGNSGIETFAIRWISNDILNQKMFYGMTSTNITAGEANAPNRSEMTYKLDQVTLDIDILDVTDTGASGPDTDTIWGIAGGETS